MWISLSSQVVAALLAPESATFENQGLIEKEDADEAQDRCPNEHRKWIATLHS